MPSDVATPKARPPLLEYGLLLALATLWGSSFTFLKISVMSIPPITAAAARALLACLLLYAILRLQGGRLPRDLATWKSFVALGAVNTLIPFILIAWGIQWVDASLTVILNSTTPIFAFLITWGVTRHEAATARRLFGLMVGLLGIVLIVGAAALSGLGSQIMAQVAIVLGSLSYAASAIYGPRFRHMGPLLPAIASLLLASLVLVPVALVVEQPWTATPTLASLGALLTVGLFGTALGNVLYFRLLGTLGTISTTSQAYLRVPIGVLVSILLLGESLSSSGLLGLICVVIGVAAMTIPRGAMAPMVRAVRNRLGRHLDLVPEYLLLLVLSVLWAGSYVWVKIGLASIPPLTLMLGRIVVAALFLLVVLKLRGLSLPRDRGVWVQLAAQGILATVIPFSLVAWGQQWVDAGAAAILNSLSPVFVFLITWGVTRHEPANPLKLFGVIAGLSGVVVVVGPSAQFRMGSEILPPMAMVVASVSYALGAINSRHFRGSDPAVSATGALLCAAAVLLPFAVVLERPWTVSPTWDALGAVLAVGVLSTACGFLIYFRLARTIGSLGVSTQSYIRAPIGVALGAIVLGEAITSPLLVGMLLVVIGVGAMTLPVGGAVSGASKRA